MKQINILFTDARWTFEPISEETNLIIGFVTFLCVVSFRMLVWIYIIILIEWFFIAVCAGN